VAVKKKKKDREDAILECAYLRKILVGDFEALFIWDFKREMRREREKLSEKI
jgi:hypothetical protein